MTEWQTDKVWQFDRMGAEKVAVSSAVCLRSCMLFLTIATFFVITLLLIDDYGILQKPVKTSTSMDYGQSFMTQDEHNNTTKIILLWNKFFFSDSWGLGFGVRPFQNRFCKYSTCVTTANRSYTSQAAVVLFHCRDRLDAWPTIRHPWQLYTVHCSESPAHSNLKPYNNRVNITSTYRLDSDIKTPIFFLRRKLQPVTTTHRLKFSLESRPKYVAWVVSNCQTASKREDYVRELSRHIPVDIYGRCGSLNCSASRRVQCFKNLFMEYKFYLSFENSICVDYVTEKLLNPMLYGEIIPVVLGGANYTQHVPAHSYINARDFNTPRDLANYLHILAQNETEYSRYFEWKTKYDVIPSWRRKMFCELCEIAHSGTYHKEWGNVQSWWGDGACDGSLVSRMRANWTTTR